MYLIRREYKVARGNVFAPRLSQNFHKARDPQYKPYLYDLHNNARQSPAETRPQTYPLLCEAQDNENQELKKIKSRIRAGVMLVQYQEF